MHVSNAHCYCCDTIIRLAEASKSHCCCTDECHGPVEGVGCHEELDKCCVETQQYIITALESAVRCLRACCDPNQEQEQEHDHA